MKLPANSPTTVGNELAAPQGCPFPAKRRGYIEQETSVKTKPLRVLTITPGAEFIDVDANGTIWWRGREESALGVTYAGFPVTLAFLSEKFKEAGRTFDESKLPANVVRDPYVCFTS